ncbi:MAG: response regulator, partial [Candidatus Binatia bacterium]
PQSYSAPKPVRRAPLTDVSPSPLPSLSVSPAFSVPAVAAPITAEPEALLDEIGDDRERLEPGDPRILIVDNDENFARFLLDLAHDHGFKGLVSSSGAAAVALARDYQPDAITLDIRLPDIDGWKVFDRLRNDLATRHIPVHVISTDEEVERGLGLGAVTVIPKPIRTKETLDRAFEAIRTDAQRDEKVVLVVMAEDVNRIEALSSLGGVQLDVISVATREEALERLAKRRVDCVVVEPMLGDRSGLELAEEIVQCANGDRPIPVLMYSARPLGKKEEALLRRLSESSPVRSVHSPDRLLDLVTFFAHVPTQELPREHRARLERLHQSNALLAGKKVLVVDDDIRNIFALTSVLEKQEMQVLSAETGQAAIDTLQTTPGIDVVLMDIMMPGMDGYDAIRAIRRQPRFRSLPIVAVTAKAMKGDREKTIEAGAWDYLSKPVDADQMLSVLRAWLCR